MITSISRGLAILLLVLTRCVPDTVDAQSPMPVARPLSPKAKAQLAAAGQTMAKTKTVAGPITQVVAQPGKVITLAADFASITETRDVTTDARRSLVDPSAIIRGETNVTMAGMIAFIDVTTNLGASIVWTRTSLPYYPLGGTFAMPWTNNSPSPIKVYWRAGYQFLASP